MLWLGIIIGFVTGVVFITLCYTPLVDKVKLLEQKGVYNQKLIDDAIQAIQSRETQIARLQMDLEVMQRLVSPELYAQFYDAPYRDT